MGKVDIDIAPRAHAILSASSADRWLVCTPSARIEEKMPDTSSSAATDGTAAHAFAELRLRYLLKQIDQAEYKASYIDTKLEYADIVAAWMPSDWEAIDEYIVYVLKEVERLEGDVYIEARISYTKYAQDGFGTSDVLIVSRKHRIIKSIDLKFGKGVPVYAGGNAQAKLYALGGLIAHDPTYKEFDAVEWAIVQPRLDYIGEDSDTVADLIKWAEEVVAPAAKKAWLGKGELVPSEKGCRFCKIAPVCRARVAENVLIARRDFVEATSEKPTDIRMDDYMLGMDEVAKILPNIDGWIAWANQLKKYALEAARDRGEEIDGYKLIRGRSNRSWKPDTDVVEKLRALGVSETNIFPEPAPPAPRSVAQLEKAMGKKNFSIKVEPVLVVKPLGTPALVPNEDGRPAMNAAAEAKAGFGK